MLWNSGFWKQKTKTKQNKKQKNKTRTKKKKKHQNAVLSKSYIKVNVIRDKVNKKKT